MHHLTVRGLQPGTLYAFVIGTGSSATFDKEGAPFTVKTGAKLGAPPAAQTAYGNVLGANGAPAANAVVYMTIDGVGELSSLVKASGSYAIPLSTARTQDGSAYANLTEGTTILVTAQNDNETAELVTTVGQTQPVEEITLGSGRKTAEGAGTAPTSKAAAGATTPGIAAAGSSGTTLTGTDGTGGPSTTLSGAEATPSASPVSMTSLTSSSPLPKTATSSPSASTATVVDVDATTAPTVTTNQPTIVGKAAPGATIQIQVNSETQINDTVTANADGTFEFDLSSYAEGLEPGEHVVTITYLDENGVETTKQQTFYVNADGTTSTESTANGTGGSTTQLALASASPTPFGSGNPYPAGTATPSATPKTATTSTKTSTTSGRTTIPSTKSAVPVSGSVGTTLALLVGGVFFLFAGGWSLWIARALETPIDAMSDETVS